LINQALAITAVQGEKMNFARTITEISNKYEGNPIATQAVQDMQRCFVAYLEQILNLNRPSKTKGAIPMNEATISKQLEAIFDKYDHPATVATADDFARLTVSLTLAATSRSKHLPAEVVAIRAKYAADPTVSADLQMVANLALDLVEVIVKDLRAEVKHAVA
jgi:hypothetical protein